MILLISLFWCQIFQLILIFSLFLLTKHSHINLILLKWSISILIIYFNRSLFHIIYLLIRHICQLWIWRKWMCWFKFNFLHLLAYSFSIIINFTLVLTFSFSLVGFLIWFYLLLLTLNGFNYLLTLLGILILHNFIKYLIDIYFATWWIFTVLFLCFLL